MSAGAIELAVVSMSVHATAADVQEAGCRVLRNISAGPANKSAVATAGGMESARLFPGSPKPL